MTEHLSRWQLERLIAGDVPPGPGRSGREELKLAAHVLGCDVCTTRKRAIETARTRLLTLHPPADFAGAVLSRAANAPSASAPARRAGGLARFTIGGALLATAAACILWMQRPSSDGRHEQIRFKGSATLEVFVKRGEHVNAIHDGEVLAPGDQLGFVYTLTEPRHLLLLGIDDTGAIARYYPSEGAPRVPLAAGARVQLPLGVELDDHLGEERLIALFAPEPIDEAEARRALARAFERSRGRGGLAALGRLELPAQQAGLWFRKP